MSEIEQKIRQFIAENFMLRHDRADLSDTDSLLEAGLIDSTGVLELVGYLESEFQIAVLDAEIIPENLDSIRTITAYIGEKLAERAAA